LLRCRRHLASTLFPYTTLFRSAQWKTRRLSQGFSLMLKEFACVNGLRPYCLCHTVRGSDAPPRRNESHARPQRPSTLPSMFTLRSEEHTSELQSLAYLVCRLLL